MKILQARAGLLLPFAALACAGSVGSAGRASTASDGAGVSPTADSALIGRILLAEDRRDTTDAALAEGARSHDPRVRLLARRALGRTRDPKYSVRDSTPGAPAPVIWPEPAWRLRFRALAAARGDCGALRAALADSAWPVRLHATDLVGPACTSDDAMASTLRTWVDALPLDASRRSAGGVSWHASAHALVALARARPAEARPRVKTLAAHAQWQARMYAARAAEVLADTATLRSLARDPNDDVKEAAIEALAKVSPGDVDLFVAALGDTGGGPQVVRAAAIALKGNPRPDVARAANAAFERWVGRANASERDVRVALLEAAGRPATEDRPPALHHELPPQTVALALGAEVRLRVRMSPTSGGGAFVVRLHGDAAPMMAARILALARGGYYDGLTWHRVEHDFVIQGGSPGASEYVGLPHYLRDELGTVPHLRGTVGMSTRGHDTGDAQWFVNLKDNLRLNGDYTVFGDVVEGMDVVDGVMEGDAIERIEVVGR
jgi:cyclophilin family peptidyl-prolyl cis-trans isomerase